LPLCQPIKLHAITPKHHKLNLILEDREAILTSMVVPLLKIHDMRLGVFKDPIKT
jgi:hypothetical protein